MKPRESMGRCTGQAKHPTRSEWPMCPSLWDAHLDGPYSKVRMTKITLSWHANNQHSKKNILLRLKTGQM